MFSKAKLISKLRILENVFYRSESTDAGKVYSLLFFDEKVQKLLREMTNVDLEKVFAPRPLSKKLAPSVYQFMTTSQFEAEKEKYVKRANYFLQIPPLVNIREDKTQVLREDFGIEGYERDHAKMVFTDISPDVSDEFREIVVREPNGVLRTATRFERHRMNQIYNPMEGRTLETPKMFEDEHLKKIIDREDYVFILDKACIQFEPYEPAYHKVISAVYEAINSRGHFERLHSTRHFGSLAFYLVTHKNIDDLLLDNIKSKRIKDAFCLVEVYHIIHPTCESAKLRNGKSDMEILKDYISLDSKKKSKLELSLQDYVNKENSEEKLEQAQSV